MGCGRGVSKAKRKGVKESIPKGRTLEMQTAVERARLAALVVQSPLNEQLAGVFPGHGNLLRACVKIATIINIARSFHRAFVV